jgi:hypothetical protein
MISTFQLSKVNFKTCRYNTKFVAIYLFLVTDFASWDSCKIKIGNLAKLVPKFDNN